MMGFVYFVARLKANVANETHGQLASSLRTRSSALCNLDHYETSIFVDPLDQHSQNVRS